MDVFYLDLDQCLFLMCYIMRCSTLIENMHLHELHLRGTFSFLPDSDSKQGKIAENGWPDDASAFTPGMYRFDLEPD